MKHVQYFPKNKKKGIGHDKIYYEVANINKIDSQDYITKY